MPGENGNETPLVLMEKIVKRFGQVTALEGVDFEVKPQEVMALLGDNGAGKSTLIKILTGVHTPSSGQIYFEGRPVQIGNPQEARALGIETVYQDLALVNSMSLGRNFFLGREPVHRFGPLRWLDMRTMARQTCDSLADIGIKIRSANEKVGKLSGGERQSIAIGRAVHFGVKLLILDEPTSALSVAESRKVLDYTLNAKARGLSVIFITHNVHHVMAVADRYSIIRHGQKVGTYARGEITFDDISDLITGQRLS
ncbi:MAG: sugar ABC transporter ATP-binding protein [Anaerolineales bacterium]|nr:sugar ABC transporter ATP-binding protein [Anaerolineales bacterium]